MNETLPPSGAPTPGVWRRESCPGVEFDESYLEALRLRLHVVEADHDAFAPEAHDVAEVLKRAIAEAPSRQAWCAAVLRLYGPEGTMMKGMLGRRKVFPVDPPKP